MLKLVVLICATIALSSAAFADQVDVPQPNKPFDVHTDIKQCSGTCTPHVVDRRKIVGYKTKTVRVPIYEHRHEVIPAGDCCKPETVAPSPEVVIPPPAPKVVEQQQEIVVVTKPHVTYAPSPQVQIAPPAPIVYQQPERVIVAPAPAPRVIQSQIDCPPPPVPNCCGPAKRIGARIINRSFAQNVPQVRQNPGYIPGAPRNRAECLALGGTDDGLGCRGWSHQTND